MVKLSVAHAVNTERNVKHVNLELDVHTANLGIGIWVAIASSNYGDLFI